MIIKEDYKKQIRNILEPYLKKELEINRIIDYVLMIRDKYYRDTRIDKEDISSELKVILLEAVQNFNNWGKEKDFYRFLNYLNQVLYNRLQDRTHLISFIEEDCDHNYNISLEALDVPIEILDQTIQEEFEGQIVSKINLENFYKKLSFREKQVYYYIFIKDYTQETVADILGINQKNIFIYKERILKKYINYVYKN